ncbi:MAG: hypothetical protein ACM3X5_01510 [Bacillota bacterium]
MKTLTVSLPEAILVIGTRAMAGVGIGLLLANQLITPERKRLGWSLIAVGALSTIPLAMRILPRLRDARA